MSEFNQSAPLKRNLWVVFGTLLASSGTLICCVLPAVMVSLGAGAALAGLVTAIPQLVWLSAHKIFVFGFAFIMLGISGFLLNHARSLPCPSDPVLGKACSSLRKVSWFLWSSALLLTILGSVFAFILPYIK